MSRLAAVLVGVVVTALFSQSVPIRPQGAELTRLKQRFARPSRDYSSGPLWVWNGLLSEQQLTQSLRDIAAQGIRQVWVHPRPGLMTPYLSREWFDLWKAALREAERLDMNVWIYDENSYPSGFAGGFVPEEMPEARGRGLQLRDSPMPPNWSDDTLRVYRLEGEICRDVTAACQAGETLPQGRYVTASILRSQPSPWHGGKTYVDLLYPGVTARFLSITLDAYRREVGSEFGRRIPGVFTDEPEIRPAGGLPWTPDLPAAFEKRWSYRLDEHLPSLLLPVGDWKKVRHNYYQTLLELFVERWARPYYKYCERNRLEFTGHYWEHSWPNADGVPDNMAMSAWQQRPGIDTLMNQYSEDVHAQFGNIRSVKEVGSVANQLGRKRTLCEAYGAAGWDLRFEDMKRIGDWLYVLGINTLNQHLSYVTIRGARKRDHPQSFSYHEPWWEAYHTSAEYFGRLSVALTAGEQVNEILVLEPTTTAWMFNAPGSAPRELQDLGNGFQQLVTSLEKAQVEFDIGCEAMFVEHASVEGATFHVGRRAYKTFVLPRMTQNLNSRTVELLEEYLNNGGRVVALGPPPERIDGTVSPRGRALASKRGWVEAQWGGPIPFASGAEPPFSVSVEKGLVFHHRRELNDGDLVFLVNSARDAPATAAILSDARAAEVWDLRTGATRPARFEYLSKRIRVPVELPPCGSLLLFLSKTPSDSAPATAPAKLERVAATGSLEARRIGPNVLVLDFVDVSAGGEKLENAYFYRASQAVFRANGLPRNPWDSAVQFRDELISLRFPRQSGFSATYRFHVRQPIASPLWLVVERPDLYSITVNGRAVVSAKGEWWLDRSFGKLEIGTHVRIGENTVILEAAPMTVFHELEPVYLLGDFSLSPTDRGFEVLPARALATGPWDEQGMPFYAEGVTYGANFDLDPNRGPLFDADRLRGSFKVALQSWLGSVARVDVNGTRAGYIGEPPWELEVSGLLRPGRNRLEVTVIGTLKNTLGPHHGSPAPGSAWPAMFQKGPESGPPPGREYSTIGYGLFEPFLLLGTSQGQVVKKLSP